jgi:hypothetical protein
LETDSEKLTVKIAKAETTIQQRNAELLQKSPANSAELEAIARALRVLNVLKDIVQKHTELVSVG